MHREQQQNGPPAGHPNGTLYMVATPLGNLDDITIRAVETLRTVEAIACEDTRRASILLRHLGIAGKKLISYHSFNEEKAIERITGMLEEGIDLALITDAGTPAVSDPGYSILAALNNKGLRAVPIPGPSALSAAVSVCPLPTSSFYFAGFLPHKKGRKTRLEQLSAMQTLFVLYESPFRILKLLDELEALIPDCRIFIGREMTKMHEEYITGSIGEIRLHLSTGKTRGEFVVAVQPPEQKPAKRGKYDADRH
ncbi:16S rRNA (cytidine(1402)-2'-O)-methyltransferase [Chlorobium phaeovibrioides]|uniref:Ribosomal RNA small subunit methyltransferase I n=2 Tax=Chlorobium phaeovibrioides TaxID=1094 RepID=A0A3S0MR60_CHLPH|nr:16S rRNA (cytidine(1402)-2'-O)-methyltransferase [Chlorobium phaeovibrioides]RTY35857.1 16S rRNA (cytidine(1402)-2'-O)-methyltransferase [Chlorobium phaeovibrioides]RTY39169.1 16S rRNA (cytidine(1402)-2'-O)-methyltransferase [Chlorobium phaeovibrioides]